MDGTIGDIEVESLSLAVTLSTGNMHSQPDYSDVSKNVRTKDGWPLPHYEFVLYLKTTKYR